MKLLEANSAHSLEDNFYNLGPPNLEMAEVASVVAGWGHGCMI